MCGRFTLTATSEMIQQAFNLDTLPQTTPPRYNIAPSQPVALITNENPRELTFHRWGLIPSWSKDPKIGSRMINARAETAHEKPSFRAAFKRRRCLIPATGFYEWQKRGEKDKSPMYVHLKDHALFAFAGLWEVWHSPEGDEIRTCTILTTEPNSLVKPIHNRMAVILEQAHYADWLAPEELPTTELMPLLKAYDAAQMRVYEVSKTVNSPYNDSPQCIEPFNRPDQPPLFQ
jgi:putative SOS response-associated peptidase YedK